MTSREQATARAATTAVHPRPTVCAAVALLGATLAATLCCPRAAEAFTDDDLYGPPHPALGYRIDAPDRVMLALRSVEISSYC